MPGGRDIRAKRDVFFRYLNWLLAENLSALEAHVAHNGSIEWFRNRISFPMASCAIISTGWLFATYRDWKEHFAAQLSPEAVEALQYNCTSGEQKSFTLFVRHVLLGRMGKQSERIKGQDTLEGTSEYFLVIKGGLASLQKALQQVAASGPAARRARLDPKTQSTGLQPSTSAATAERLRPASQGPALSAPPLFTRSANSLQDAPRQTRFASGSQPCLGRKGHEAAEQRPALAAVCMNAARHLQQASQRNKSEACADNSTGGYPALCDRPLKKRPLKASSQPVEVGSSLCQSSASVSALAVHPPATRSKNKFYGDVEATAETPGPAKKACTTQQTLSPADTASNPSAQSPGPLTALAQTSLRSMR